MMLRFEIPGAPVGKGRPRFAKRGAFVRTYTPEKTASYENLVKLAAQSVMSGKSPLEGPVGVKVIAFFPIPESASKKNRAAMLRGELLPTKKPDADNVAKIICDAMNGISYRDDAQVCYLRAIKLYSDHPRTLVVITEIKPNDLLGDNID